MNQMIRCRAKAGLRVLLLLAAMPLLQLCRPTDPNPADNAVYTLAEVDQPPMPAGGDSGLNQFLATNLRYPAEAQRARIMGRLVVDFVVTRQGSITDVQVAQRLGGGCDEEAMRVVKLMPNWTPGQKNGQPVNVKTSKPFSFTML
ncbi:TonB family protein [Fibrella aestuarina BUZ 2]|uniref:TonB family protein n=1 Tax=Fibrella aestuarina BUZ 2 TaxID=1166018 RepID=I0KF30_9BACT|nr:energy transducer TonB [Fibrella aestuarina]CCH02733.1 TonB family protein [Fibrella aestuarina BUZ 2]